MSWHVLSRLAREVDKRTEPEPAPVRVTVVHRCIAPGGAVLGEVTRTPDGVTTYTLPDGQTVTKAEWDAILAAHAAERRRLEAERYERDRPPLTLLPDDAADATEAPESHAALDDAGESQPSPTPEADAELNPGRRKRRVFLGLVSGDGKTRYWSIPPKPEDMF